MFVNTTTTVEEEVIPSANERREFFCGGRVQQWNVVVHQVGTRFLSCVPPPRGV